MTPFSLSVRSASLTYLINTSQLGTLPRYLPTIPRKSVTFRFASPYLLTDQSLQSLWMGGNDRPGRGDERGGGATT